jgi:hypothetical protein
MWTCAGCSESIEDQFEICWSCGTSREGRPDPHFRRRVQRRDLPARPDPSAPSLVRPFIALFAALAWGIGGVGIFGLLLGGLLSAYGLAVLMLLSPIVLVASVWGAWKVDRLDDRAGSALDRVGCLVVLVALALLSGGLLVLACFNL